uniref:Porin n=2 Tax=Aromatoleum toluolicum TaxID=90060 RepID=A0ABX1NCD0_9RHOO|nr:porin [Aromatoleum toluolicum]
MPTSSHRPSHRTTLVATLIASGCSLAGSALATQGTFPHGYGVKSEGMGGAGIALAQDGLAGATNPAGMVEVGNRLDLGAAFLKVDNGSRFGSTRFDGSADKSLYVIPQLGANRMLDDASAIGLSVVGNGVGTAYRHSDDIGGLRGPRSELKQMVATASYARKLDEANAIGAGLVLARQVLTIHGPGGLGLPEGRDESYGAGVRLGWTGHLGFGLSLGAAYASRIRMSRMDEFRGLLAEHGDLDVPANYGAGIAWRIGATTLAVDYLRIEWSDVRSLGNPGVTSADGPPGSREGPGFGWRDQSVWRVGIAHAVTDALTLRAGYNHGTKLLDPRDGFLGVLAPSANRRHATLGASYALAKGTELSVAYARSFKETVHGQGPAPDGITDLYMGQHWLSVAYGVRF